MLTDKRLNDGERLTRAWRSHNPCTTEGVDDIDPSLAELTLVVVAHGDVDAVLVLYLGLHLLETFVLEVEAVFQQAILQILGDIVEGDMNQHRADNGHQEINPCTAVQGEEGRSPMTIEYPHREEHQNTSKRNGIDDHLLGIELQMFLVAGADTGHANHQERHDLAAKHVAVLIDIHQLDAVMDVNENAAPEVQQLRVNGILEELQHQGSIDEGAEYLIQRL